uniref:Uncharacterized protein n=1 Tax=Heterorhabditis bacteriophora TaxID=37862 RepID=A0A1I7WBB2_HETBA
MKDVKDVFMKDLFMPHCIHTESEDVTNMKWTVFAVLVLACILNVFAWADSRDDPNVDQLMARVYRTVLLKSKRSPSMGLSLAEYMASPQGGDNFHFIPSEFIN